MTAAAVAVADGLRQTRTLAWRTVVQVRHNPWVLSDFSIQPIIFVLLFTYVFGGAIAGDWRDYLDFMLPGLLVQNMLFVTLYVGQGLNADVTRGRVRPAPLAADRPVGAAALLLVFALAFSWVSVLVGLVAKDAERVQVFGFTAILPLTFVSNVFVPAETMPGWLQAFVDVNPVSVLTDACRALLLGDGAATGPVLGSLAWTAAVATVFAPLSVRAFRRRA